MPSGLARVSRWSIALLLVANAVAILVLTRHGGPLATGRRTVPVGAAGPGNAHPGRVQPQVTAPIRPKTSIPVVSPVRPAGSAAGGPSSPIRPALSGANGTPVSMPPPPSAQTGVSGPPIAFTVRGDQILEPDGQQYIPYGFVVYCLSEPDLSCNASSASDDRQIQAAATYWHANTVRIQTAWEHLLNDDGTVNGPYLQMLDGEVQLANRLGMVAIITLQTERYAGSAMPDEHALKFWKAVATHYRSNPHVMFDLFNEPRYTSTEASVWQIWQYGGTVPSGPNGPSATYVGMQELVDEIRATGAENVVVAEGVHEDHDLSQLPEHVLAGTNVAYGDEPSLRETGRTPDATPAQWQSNWGGLAARYPLVMEAFLDYPGASACNSDSPSLVPKELSYLRALHLGLLYWSMDAGVGVVGTDLEHPTSFSSSSFDCSARLASNTQGPGTLIRDWFLANSRPT